MRNPLRTGAATPEPAPLVDTLAAINVTLANVKSDRLIRLESAARVAADERANAASLYRIAHGEACNLQPDRPKEMPSEREARLALETAEKRSHEARRALREARAADLPAFQRAVETGDLQSLLDILAPDVVAMSDGGGVKQAVLRPIVGADRVVRLFAAALDMVGAELSLEPVQVNGSPALIMRLNGEIDSVLAMRVAGGLVTGLYAVRNPEKLSRVKRETALSRLS